MASPNKSQKWIAVDFDGTLTDESVASYPQVGPPVWSMVNRVKAWLAAGRNVKIFTARLAQNTVAEELEQVRLIDDFCDSVGLPHLPITNRKDQHCVQLWDNRAVSVESNTGAYMDANSEDNWVAPAPFDPGPYTTYEVGSGGTVGSRDAQHVGPSLPNLDPQLTLWSQEPDPFRFLTDPTEYDAASRAGDEYEARTR